MPESGMNVARHRRIFPPSKYLLTLVLIIFSNFPLFGQEGLPLDSLLNLHINKTNRYEQKVTDADQSISIVTAEEIRNFGWDNVTEVLNSVRGIYLTDDRSYQQLGFRGLSGPNDGNARILVMIDGHPLNDALTAHGPTGIEIAGLNVDHLERIEVTRGPASAAFSNAGVIGTINLVTKNGKQEDGLKINAETGSFVRTQASVHGGKLFENGLDLSFSARGAQLKGQSLFYEEFDSLSPHFGAAEKLDWRKSLGLQFAAAYKGLGLSAFYTTRASGIPTAAFGTEFGNLNFQLVDNHFGTELKYAKELNDRMELSAKVNMDLYQFRGNYPYRDTLLGLVRETMDALWGGAELKFRWDILHNNRIVAGIRGQNYFDAANSMRDSMGPGLDEDFSLGSFSLFVQDEFQILSSLRLVAGVRLDKLINGTMLPGPNASLVFHPGKNSTFKLIYGRGYRAPSPAEAAMVRSQISTGNPLLANESVNSAEFLFEQRMAKHFLFTAGLFSQQFSNFIYPVADTGGTGLYSFYNVPNVRNIGAEVEFSIRKPSGFNLFLNSTFQKGSNSDSASGLSNSPQWFAKFGATVPMLRLLRVSADGIAEAGRLMFNGNSTEPYFLLNGSVVILPFYKPNSGLQITFRIQNILDTEYRLPAGPGWIQNGIIQNGINFRLKIQYGF